MAERKPSKWCASNYTNSITLKKLTDEALRWPRGTYHDTWGEAHAALVARRQKELTEAEREFQRARNALAKAKRMPPPATATGVMAVGRVQRLMDACEGELDGLAVPRVVARRILAFVDGGTSGLIAEAANLGEEAERNAGVPESCHQVQPPRATDDE